MRRRRLSEAGEKAATRMIVEKVLAPRWRCPSLGPGDDASCVGPGQPRLLVKIDGGSIAGSRPAWMGLRCLGWQWVAAAASDLAAKAARPAVFLVSLGVPAGWSTGQLLELVEGAAEAAEAHGAWLAGGDTNADPGGGGWLDVAAVGEAAPAWGPIGMRPGAGDAVFATVGRLGLGWLALRYAAEREPPEGLRRALLEWARPLARLGFVDLASRLPGGCLSAATDTSDGLAEALGRLAEAAGGEAVLEAPPPLHPAAEEEAERLGFDPLEAALYGGQEYEVVFTAPPHCVDRVLGEAAGLGLGVALLGRLAAGGRRGWVRCCGRLLPGRGWDQFLGGTGGPV